MGRADYVPIPVLPAQLICDIISEILTDPESRRNHLFPDFITGGGRRRKHWLGHITSPIYEKGLSADRFIFPDLVFLFIEVAYPTIRLNIYENIAPKPERGFGVIPDFIKNTTPSLFFHLRSRISLTSHKRRSCLPRE